MQGSASSAKVTATEKRQNHMKPLQDFVKAHFGVAYEDEILVWGPIQEQRHGWQAATLHDITATFTFDKPINVDVENERQAQNVYLGDVPEDHIEGAINPFQRDLRGCAIYGMKAIAGRSTYPVFTTFRTSHIHPDNVEGMEEQDDQQVAGGGVRGSVAYVPPFQEEPMDIDAPFLGVRNFHFENPEFCKSLAYVTPTNLMNGIFMIPRQVCIASYHASYFPVYAPEDPTLTECPENEGKILFWYFVPLDHVLAWAFHSPPEYRVAHKLNVITYRVRRRKKHGGDVFKLGFLVCNNTLNRAKKSFLRSFADKVYFTDLRGLNVEMVPAFNMGSKDPSIQQRIPKHGVHEGQAQLRVKIAYCLYESLSADQIARLCPTLSPHFPSFMPYAHEQIARIGMLYGADQNSEYPDAEEEEQQ